MIRLLYLVPNDLHPGMCEQLAMVANRLHSAGFAVVFCVMQHANGFGWHARNAILGRAQFPVCNVSFRFATDIAAWRKVHELVRSGGQDLVHVFDGPSDWPSWLVGLMTDAPVTISRPTGFFQAKPWQRWLRQRIVKRPNVQHIQGPPYESATGELQPAISVPSHGNVSHGVGGEDHRLQAALGLSAGARLIGLFGPFLDGEGIKQAIWATDLIKNVWDDVHLVLWGNGPQRARLERFIQQTETTDRVHLVSDWTTDELLPRLFCYWQTTHQNANPYFLLRAMAAGLPVVASDIAAYRGIIQHGKNGFLFPAGDRAALARRTHLLLEEVEMARNLGASARADVEQHHPLDAAIHSWAEFYRFRASRQRWPKAAY